MISPTVLNISHGTQDVPHSTHDTLHGTEHPHVTEHTLYRVVNNFVPGTESGQESFELYLTLKQCFLEGVFNMRRWDSNDQALVQRTESKKRTCVP